MGMGGFVPAFIKVGVPDLSFNSSEWPGIFCKQSQRKRKFQTPDQRLSDLRFDHSRQTGKTPDLLVVFGCQGCEFMKPPVHARGIRHVRRQKSAAAIKLKIKVSSDAFRLNKKFHATVFPDIALK